MQRGRSAVGRGRTASRASTGTGRKPAGTGRSAGLSSGAHGSHDRLASEVQELLELQREAGNQAVTYLIEAPRVQRQGEPGGQPRLPKDVDPGFNPIDRAHNLVRAIDQSDVKVTGGFAMAVDRRNLRRNVDFPAVVRALDGLTTAQVAAVDAEYRKLEGNRGLERDLLGSGQSGFPADLTHAQQMRIRALLGGTQAGLDEDPQAAKARRLEADAAELNQLLYGKRSAEVVERVAVILRRSGEENAELATAYERLFVTRLGGDLMRLGAQHSARALALLGGYPVAADAMRLGRLRLRLGEIDAKLSEINPVDTGRRFQVALSHSPYLLRYDIERLQKERRQITSEIDQLVGATMEEGGAEQLQMMTLGNLEGLLEQIVGPAGQGPDGRATADVIRARVGGSVPARTAAELRRLQASGKLTAAALTQALRGLRDEADRDARRLHPDADEAMLTAETRLLSDQYLADLRRAWDGQRSADEPTFEQLLAKGNETERELNQALAARGRPDDVTELVLALRGGRKDLETVKRILADKQPDEIEQLKKDYHAKTGRTLDFELFGNAPTRAGQGNVVTMPGGRYLVGPDGVMRPAQLGKASGSDRLLLEDYLQRVEEGGWKEIQYLAARAEREYSYTIENRGATGWWRDKWGNEARSLLDASIREIRQIKRNYAALVLPTGFGSLVLRPQMARTAEASEMLQRVRLLRATIRGDRAAYEEATAKLRATFQAAASFVLQAALTALLTPAASALFAMRGVAFARTALVTFVRTTSVSVASQVGSNLVVYGNEYSVAMLKRDLLTGLGGALGGKAAEKLAEAALASVAKGLADRLGARASQEIVQVANTVGSMEGSAVAEGKSLTEDLTIQNVLEQYLMGKAGEAMTEQTRRRLGLGKDVAIDPERYRRWERTGRPAQGGEPLGQLPATTGEEAAEPGEGYVPMSLPEPVPARSGERVGPGEAAGRPDVDSRFDYSDVVVLDAGGRGNGRTPGGGAPAGPAGPAHKPHGIPEASARTLQDVANQLDVVIKARPLNPAAEGALARGAVPKMELVKAKTINELDVHLGAPPDALGMVGLFQPKDPPSNLPPELLAKVNERRQQRAEEFAKLSGEYRQLEQQGLVRLEGALLKVRDPRVEAGDAAEFKAVAGDIDIFDITHADGTPLTNAQRDYVINLMRSQGIGVEHGAHMWWRSQSPETYSEKADLKIRQEHLGENPLVAFVPGEGIARVWADTAVTRPPRESRPGERITPLRDATAIEQVSAPDTSRVNEASEIAQRPAEPGFEDIVVAGDGGGPAGRGPGNGGGGPVGPGGGGGEGPGPIIPGRPPGFPSVESLGTRARQLMPPAEGSQAVAAAVVVLEDRVGTGPPEQRVYTERSSEEPGVPRSELTQPGRRVNRPGLEYGPDESGALTVPVRGTPGENVGYGPLVERRLQELVQEWRVAEAARTAERNRRATEKWAAAKEKKPRTEPSAQELAVLQRRAEREVAEREAVEGHGGTREHDAEAKLMERVADELLPGDRGEVHLATNFATCPACTAMLYQFQADHPRVRLIVHAPSLPRSVIDLGEI